jgi:hypothetical protein
MVLCTALHCTALHCTVFVMVLRLGEWEQGRAGAQDLAIPWAPYLLDLLTISIPGDQPPRLWGSAYRATILILKYFIQSHAIYNHKAEKDWTEAIMLI